MIFNAGNGKIAEDMGLPWSWDEFVSRSGERVRYRKAGPEAMQIINHYHKVMPGVKELAARAKRTIEQRGFIYTRSGRRIRLPRDKAYKASGLLIQATAADINKEAWVKSSETARQLGGRLLLNVHDSYSFSLPAEQLKQSFSAIRTRIEDVPDFKIPLVLEQKGVGSNWWEASK
jgi:DNA polymerase I-like protein with 3'-5' exonuclease and polymerase domains